MLRNSLIVALLGLLAEAAEALSLGAPQGKVWLGQPIDLGFEVQLDPGMSVDALCPQVRLVSGDAAVPAGRVQVSVRPGDQERNPVLRVQSSHLADEPVLTAQVSVHCTGRVMREYTFLADLPATVAAGLKPVAIPWEVPLADASPSRAAGVAAGEASSATAMGPSRPRKVLAASRVARKGARVAAKSTGAPVARTPSPDTAAMAGATSGTQPAPQEPPSTAPSVAPETPAAPPAQASASSTASVAPAAATAAPGPAKPRLVMEPLTALVTPPASGEGAPSDGAALTPLAASTPEVNALDGAGTASARMQALQVEVDRMRAQAEQDHQATLALLARVEQLNAGHFPASLVYGLLAMLALTVGAAGWLLARMRRAMDASNEEWRNTLTAYVAQSSLPAAVDAEAERRTAVLPADDRPAGLPELHGAGVLPA
ncbi:type IV pilus assembly protein FimV [Acidovorax sp. M14]|uniref:type IV pilus assembly protein FimV n=1 Tax=Acidovorax sp. M14 TaxID=3411354 RepID=UPI003BF4A83F